MSSRKGQKHVGCERWYNDWNIERPKSNVVHEVHYCKDCGKNKEECERFRNNTVVKLDIDTVSNKVVKFTKIREKKE